MNDLPVHFTTHIDLYNPSNLKCVTKATRYLLASLQTYEPFTRVNGTSAWTVVIVHVNKNDQTIGYYLVDHGERVVCWLGGTDLADPTFDFLKAVACPKHVAACVIQQALYWRHVEQHPGSEDVDDECFKVTQSHLGALLIGEHCISTLAAHDGKS